jgi:signal transduction histidine kinase
MQSEGEYKLKRRDGSEARVKFSVTPLREKGKEQKDSIIIFQEVTRLRKLEEQAERNNRLAAMGEIAVSIAHEVRNPLGSIELLASLVRREVEGDEDKKRLMDHILAGVKSIDYVINNLLLFSKPQHPIFKQVNIHAFLDESILFILPSLKQSRIELIKKYDSFDPLVRGDLELLKQVFLNLAWNAIQAMPQGGRLIISTEIVDNSGLEFSNAAGYLELKFADSGAGISDPDKGKIFNPFFTTKEKGTGLGLAIVHNIIEVHEGMIGVESSDSRGSTFTITLPLVGKEERRD